MLAPVLVTDTERPLPPPPPAPPMANQPTVLPALPPPPPMLCATMPCEHPSPQAGSGPLAGLPEDSGMPVTMLPVFVTVTGPPLAPSEAPPPNATIWLPVVPPLPPVPPTLSARRPGASPPDVVSAAEFVTVTEPPEPP